MRATRSIPIVMLYGSAPVEVGFVTSLARPGGNVTGTAWSHPEWTPKMAELLKELKPSIVNLAIVRNPDFPGMKLYGRELDRTAPAMGLRLTYFDVTRAAQLTDALKRVAASRPDAFMFAQDPVLAPGIPELAAFARDRKLVSIGSAGGWAGQGGLLSYAPNAREIARRMVTYIDRILRGAKPSELPVEQPTKYDLEVNLKTARAIGVQVPDSLLLRADRVIE